MLPTANKRAQIINLGFTSDQADLALAHTDDVEEAVSWILDNPSNIVAENCAYWTGVAGSCRNGNQCLFIHSDAFGDSGSPAEESWLSPDGFYSLEDAQPSVPLSLSKASSKIRNELNTIETQMKSPSDPGFKETMQQFMDNYDSNKNALNLLISNYIDDPSILPDLLRLSDRMEETKEKFHPWLASSPPESLSSEENIQLSSSSDGTTRPIKQTPSPQVAHSSSKKTKKTSSSSKKPLQKRPIKDKTSGESKPKHSSQDSNTPPKHSKSTQTGQPKTSRNKSTIFMLPEKHYDHTNKDAFQCSVCFDDVEPRKGYVTERCGHSFCLNCVTEYLESKISEGAVLSIPCMDQSCKETLDYYDVKFLVSAEAFAKYEQFCFFAALKEDPMVRFCSNPKGCDNALICDPAQTKQIVCPECKYEFCFDCNEPWHTGTCEDYQKWKVENGTEDKAWQKWAQENSKSCPGCKVRTQKNTGCNHMTCTNCHMEWCWICDRQVSEGHYNPWNAFGCPGQQFSGGDEVRHSNVGKRALVGTGIVVGTAVIIPLGVAAVATIAALAVPTGLGYGAYKLGKAIKKDRNS